MKLPSEKRFCEVYRTISFVSQIAACRVSRVLLRDYVSILRVICGAIAAPKRAAVRDLLSLDRFALRHIVSHVACVHAITLNHSYAGKGSKLPFMLAFL